jgi:serine/threonine protein kinase
MLVGLGLGIGLTQSRLLGILGVESALALGLVLPSFAAALGALTVMRARQRRLAPSALELLGAASRRALLLLAIPAACLWLHGALTQSCDPVTGALFVALGPGVGVLLAAFVGVAIGVLLSPHPRLAVSLAVAAPLASALWGLWDFYSSPGIFVFDPFVGYFPGTLYDRSVRVTQAYSSYRAGSALALVTLAAGLHALHTPGLAGLSLGRSKRHRLAFGVFALGLAGLVLVRAHGPELGHRASAQHIREVLGQTLESRRCVLHVPREMPARDATRLGRDCDFRVAEAERTLGVVQRTKVIAYFYRSAGEKRRLMGADNTFIAKPWRDEVHLQLAGWPHPVLSHEVAHVVAANTARGPFRVGGSLGGWLPNAGLIEGLAVAVAFRSRVALKLLHPELCVDREMHRRFRREASILASLEHAAVVRVLDVGETDGGLLFTVMERLRGETLLARIERAPFVDPKELWPVVEDVCAGLGAAHAHGVLHGDVKPANIFLVQEQVADPRVGAKLVDFGTSKVHGLERLTRTGEVVGTPTYMAPELLTGQGVLDARMDIYAMGVVLYEALVGRPPFVERNPGRLMFRIATGKVDPLAEACPDLSPDVCSVVERAMASKAEQRFATAGELAEAFHGVAFPSVQAS